LRKGGGGGIGKFSRCVVNVVLGQIVGFQAELSLGCTLLFEPSRNQRFLGDIDAHDDLDVIAVDHFREDLAEPEEQLACGVFIRGCAIVDDEQALANDPVLTGCGKSVPKRIKTN